MSDEVDAMELLEKAVINQRNRDDAKKAIDAALVQGFLVLPPNVRNDKKLLGGRAFFAQLALKPKYEPDETVGTACTDGRTVRYNPAFVAALSKDELIGVLAHEALHPGMGHHARLNGRELDRWNIAADCEINPILREAGFVLPPGVFFPGERPGPTELKALAEQCKKLGIPFEINQELVDDVGNLPPNEDLAERYYDLLPDRPPQEGQGQGNGNDPGRCGGVQSAGDAAAQAASKADWQQAMAQAAAAGHKRGTLPGGLQRFVDRALEPSVDWADVLREFLVRSLHDRDDYSWQKPNRRFIASGLYLPGLVGEALAEFVVHVDTSGSTAPYLEAFAGELNGVLELCPCKVTIVYGDAAVQRVDEWRPGDGALEFHPDGGGGTNHTHLWEWLEEADVDPVAVVCVTDNETSHGEDPGVPVLWAIPKGHSQEVPFGRAVELNGR